MRKFMILWFMFVFILGCSFKEGHKRDILENSYVINSEELHKKIISDDLDYFLKKFKRTWNKENKNKFIQAIYYGYKEFDINPKIIMSIIAVESQYKIVVKGRNKNSIDFGLSQQNSKYIKQRYKAAEIYLRKYSIDYTNSNYDIGKNIFSCFIHLHNMSDVPELIYFKDYIDSYNKGVKGALRNKTNDLYYNKFMKEFMEI